MTQQPRAQRPEMPAGYLASKLLAWPWAERRLVEARNYWVTSVTPDGRPHARPVWGVGLDGRLYFSSGSRIRSNLERAPSVSVNLESGDECVILEGEAALVHDGELTQRIAATYNEKYDWNMEAEPGEFFEVRARTVFGWLCDASGRDGGALFSQTATRWRFD